MIPSPVERRADMLAARLRLKRKVSAVLLDALAESGLSLDQMDAAFGRPRGWTQRYIVSLMTGTTRDLDAMSDLALGMGAVFEFDLFPRSASVTPAADIGLEE